MPVKSSRYKLCATMTLSAHFRNFLDASQYGIGIVSARIAEMVLRDERSAIPIGSYQREFGVTLSLPSVVGRDGVTAIFPPELSAEGQEGLRKSAENLRTALERVRSQGGVL
ncbi:MAG TPA: hypothetical protein VF760_01950 [Xanthobacteraceae bacterium]